MYVDEFQSVATQNFISLISEGRKFGLGLVLANPRTVLQELSKYQQQRSIVSEARQRRHELQQKVRKTEGRLRRLAELYIGGAIDKSFYDKEYQSLQERRSEFSRELRKIESLALSAERMVASERAIHGLYKHYKGRLDAASENTKREIFLTFIRDVVIRGEELEVEVNLPSLAGSVFVGQGPQRLSRKATYPEAHRSPAYRSLSGSEAIYPGTPRPHRSTPRVKSSLSAPPASFPSLFLRARLMPVGKAFRDMGIQKNLGRYATKKRAG